MSKKTFLIVSFLSFGLLLLVYFITLLNNAETPLDSVELGVERDEVLRQPEQSLKQLSESETLDSAVVTVNGMSSQNQLAEGKMMTREEHLIFEATRIAKESGAIPNGVMPQIKEEDSYVSVYWPIQEDDSNVPSLGPTIAVEVYFDKTTLEVTGALGPH